MGKEPSVGWANNPTPHRLLAVGSFLSTMNPSEEQVATACQEGDVEAMQRWFPDDPTQWRSSGGSSLLHWVVQTPHLPVLDWLLTFLIDVNESNYYGTTPLMWTCLYQNEAMARRLLTQEADLQATDSRGRTALHHACAHDWVDGVVLLLQYGADPEARDNEDLLSEDHWSVSSPLHTLLAEARLGCGLK
jgi:ankyrin repeat protein